jgi:hypothetical protein
VRQAEVAPAAAPLAVSGSGLETGAAPDGRHLTTGNASGLVYLLRLAPAAEPKP